MPDTTLGITYPASTDHTRLWEHFQEMAEDVDGLIDDDRDSRDAASSSWTPVITGSTSGTWVAGGTTILANYIRQGRLVHFWIDLALGASVSITGATAGSMIISLPVTAAATNPAHVGSGLLIEGSGGRWVTAVEMNTTTTVVMVQADTGALINNQTPNSNVWADGDSIRLSGTYEAASAP